MADNTAGPRRHWRRVVWASVAVSALAGASCGGDDPTGGVGADVRPTLELAAKDTAFEKTTLTTGAGRVTVRFDNQDSGVPHNLHVSGGGIDAKTEVAAGPTCRAPS